MKKILSFIMAITLLVSCFPFAVNAANPPELVISGGKGWTARPVGGRFKSSFSDTFRIVENGKNYDFTLLYTDKNDPNSTFLAIAQNFYGTHIYDSQGTDVNTVKFDINDTTNVAHWLNNDFLQKGNTNGDKTYKLPEIIKNNINMSNVWRTECGHNDKPRPEDGGCPPDCPHFFEQTYGVTLPSVSEYHYYKNMGAYDNFKNATGGEEPWYFRTSCANNLLFMSIWDRGCVRTDNINKNWGFRPMFYLKKDFFKNADASFDINHTGSNVRNAIKSVYTQEEIKTGFTASEAKDLGKVAIGGSFGWADKPDNWRKDTPFANSFAVVDGGKNYNFTLLDVDPDDKDGTYLVMAQDFYGTHIFDTNGTNSTNIKFDVNDTTNVAHWLNNDFLQSGNTNGDKTYKLPKTVTDFVYQNSVWRTECGHSDKLIGEGDDHHPDGCPVDCAVYTEQQYPISLMSASEYQQYSGKFGSYDNFQNSDGGDNPWYFRTTCGNSLLFMSIWEEGCIRTDLISKNWGFRPMFRLKKDFFKDGTVNLNIDATGSNVRNVIKSIYTKDELDASFTKTELKKLSGIEIVGPTDWYDAPSGSRKNSAEDSSFSLTVSDATYHFTMLDSNLDDVNSTMLVLAQDYYGSHQFDANKTNKFDVTDTNNIAFWLNNGFLKAGNTENGITYALPKNIIDYININQEWVTESSHKGSVCDWLKSGGRNFKQTMGVVIPAVDEYFYYVNKFGTVDHYLDGRGERTADKSFFFRSGVGAAQVARMQYANDDGGLGAVREWGSDGTLGVRPEFYLKQDFLKKVKLNVSDMGNDVKKLLMASCSSSELKSMYTTDELVEIGTLFTKKFIDENGGDITNLTPGSKVKYSIAVDNTVGVLPVNGTAWIAYYDENNKLIDLSKSVELSVAVGQSGLAVTESITLPSGVIGGKVKGFLWNNEQTPITKTLEKSGANL